MFCILVEWVHCLWIVQHQWIHACDFKFQTFHCFSILVIKRVVPPVGSAPTFLPCGSVLLSKLRRLLHINRILIMENLSLHDLTEGLLVKHKNNNKKKWSSQGSESNRLTQLCRIEGQKVNNELTMQNKEYDD